MNKHFPMRALAAALMLASAGAMAAPGLSSNGYFRMGIGTSSEGGDQACFGLGPAKYRLGNECDDYAEIGLDAELPISPNGTVWKAHAMITGWSAYPNSLNGVDVSWSQLYLSGHNLGTGAMEGASIWVGRRYYDRPDIHILDYKYQNSDGDGAGIENVNLGFGKFSWAIERSPLDWNNNSSTEDDVVYFTNLLRLDSIKLHQDGWLTFNAGFSGGKDSRDKTTEAQNGWYLGSFYDFKVGSLDAWNRIGVQYGKGNMATGNFGQINYATVDADDTFQIFDNVTYTSGDGKWTVLANALYRKDKRTTDAWSDGTWISFGARPQYHFTDIFGVAAELGYTSLKNSGDEKTRTLTKGTVALTAASGRTAYSRPEVRLFYTYAKWNDDAKGWVGYGTPFQDKTSGSSFGIQAESWW
ncbi:carbohydrate porin [Niveibacterium sp. SC-1]|uniref:maltoporin n=1 Tax=Niveibacterium sp. SC-1 TaxID=3135646 RepID=UPI00311DBF9E